MLKGISLFAQCTETEYSFKEYAKKNIQTLDQIEGIWTVSASIKLFDKNDRLVESHTESQTGTMVIKKKGNDFIACRLPSEKDDPTLELFSKTATKGLYLYRYRDTKIDSKSTATVTAGGILNYSFEPYTDSKMLFEFQAIKIFPTEDDYAKIVHKTASGTGFALTQDGLIITNNHVIEGSETISIYGINGDFNKSFRAVIAVADANNDLAILRIDDPNFTSIKSTLYTIKTTLSIVGESISVLGFPLRASMGDEIKLTTGVISSRTGFKGDVTSYQISAPIQPGNSGGPMFDSQGNLIGIINAKHSDAENASYAIKANYLLNLIELLPTIPSLNKTNLVSGKSLPDQIQALKQSVYIIEIKSNGN